jgi:hypothetical protein
MFVINQLRFFERNAITEIKQPSVDNSCSCVLGLIKRSTNPIRQRIDKVDILTFNYSLVIPCTVFGQLWIHLLTSNFYPRDVADIILTLCVSLNRLCVAVAGFQPIDFSSMRLSYRWYHSNKTKYR